MNEKLSLLTELIKMANSDHELKDQEYRFLLAISKQLDVPQEEFDNLFHHYIKFTPPKFEYDRILQFQRLLLLMNVDQDIDPKELLHLREIGIRMGLNPLAIEEVIHSMDDYPNRVIPPQKLIDIFKTHHN